MKQRYVTFHEWGAEIIKGDEPKEGAYIPVPTVLPYVIPMEYWKLEDGFIREMNDEEKVISDKACAELPPPRTRPDQVPQSEVIDVDELIGRIQSDYMQQLAILGEEKDAQIANLKANLDSQIEQSDARNNNIMHHIQGIDDGEKSILDLMGAQDQENIKKFSDLNYLVNSLEQNNDKLHQLLEADIKQFHKNLDDVEGFSNARDQKNEQKANELDHRIEILEKNPKIEKFYIINNFHLKEYLQIAATSAVIACLLHFLLK